MTFLTGRGLGLCTPAAFCIWWVGHGRYGSEHHRPHVQPLSRGRMGIRGRRSYLHALRHYPKQSVGINEDELVHEDRGPDNLMQVKFRVTGNRPAYRPQGLYT